MNTSTESAVRKRPVSVLFVEPAGAYAGLGLDMWDEKRDARAYAGPNPVVAHPPCGRWCAMARLNERRWGAKVGDDGGCFASALLSVITYGGVLEHPAGSLAWPAFGLPKPTKGRWSRVGWDSRLWVCQVSQSAYGHRARKRTWLLFCGNSEPPQMRWNEPEPTGQVGGGVNTGFNRLPRLSKKEALGTPPEFRDALLDLAARA